MNDSFDFVVIGGGIAGVSIASHLAEHARVALLEMEHQPGYHSTGRSVSLFCETYGTPIVRTLTRASRRFYFEPPSAFCTAPLVTRRPVLMIASSGQADALQEFIASATPIDRVERLSRREAIEAFPLLAQSDLVGAALLRETADIDVHELLQGFLRLFRARGGILRADTALTQLARHRDAWTLSTSRGDIHAATVVNAAGAWAGDIGKLAGAMNIGLRPLKRSVALIEQPPDHNMNDWPLLVDAEERFYAKPSAGRLFLSPADETLSAPCDAQADDIDLAEAVDRFERATTIEVKRLVGQWAGLRSFVADREPVVGLDSLVPGFFWFAALGGYGIQTAPALSLLAASWARGCPIDAEGGAGEFPGVNELVESQLSPRRLNATDEITGAGGLRYEPHRHIPQDKQ
jgi:D-arginine dehydrogenase